MKKQAAKQCLIKSLFYKTNRNPEGALSHVHLPSTNTVIRAQKTNLYSAAELGFKPKTAWSLPTCSYLDLNELELNMWYTATLQLPGWSVQAQNIPVVVGGGSPVYWTLKVPWAT